MKYANTPNPAFKFWIENKIANERTFFVSDLRNVFQKWLAKKDKEWLLYAGSEQCVRLFIGDKDGVNAVCEKKDYPEIYRLLKPDYKKAISNESN